MKISKGCWAAGGRGFNLAGRLSGCHRLGSFPCDACPLGENRRRRGGGRGAGAGGRGGAGCKILRQDERERGLRFRS